MFDAYGFVRISDGQEIYFAPNAVLNECFAALKVGSPVELTVAEGGNGASGFNSPADRRSELGIGAACGSLKSPVK
jgi:cold shock CspA family protein